MIQILFYFYLLSALAITSIYGENVERRFCAYLLAASAATHLIQAYFPFPAYLYYILPIDTSIFVYALYLALTQSRFWPVWFAGFLMVGVASSVSILLFRELNPFLIFAASAFWSLPALACMAYGTYRDGQRRAARALAAAPAGD
ncbi:hypothetical protein L7H23_06610 [Sphingopyxis sp. BSN-002]|uniref:hypothetical protein n=1 Tax=Sphingopyxis sp. BSN-002 TaxID=2911495 RepID=UPI001EDBC882|nr:hypothetical protein [Sphingopyxis sp. BSN-002]UKK85772.1 hypothetical protein L7H23_06610 [Sphingopyxis sp. BSN-002]